MYVYPVDAVVTLNDIYIYVYPVDDLVTLNNICLCLSRR